MSPRDAASERQVTSAHPRHSTWLSANAGSGKTRVLTDRVARLLLDGASPQNILCLTYTKAAASEMQNRLFKRLGGWAMTPDDDLRRQLEQLGVEERLDAEVLARARRLFASAIETPGGLKIQTIHSFCAALLRRFPLEAGVSPQFTEAEDRAVSQLRAEVVEEMADGDLSDLVDTLAAQASGENFDKLTAEIVSRRAEFAETADWAAICDALGAHPDDTEETAMRSAFVGGEDGLAKDIADCAAQTSASYQTFAADLLALPLDRPDRATFESLCGLFLYSSGEKAGRSKSENFPQSRHTGAVAAFAPVMEDLHAFMDRVADARTRLICVAQARRTYALHAFASAFLPRFADAKEARGWLDFDDLILGAAKLLTAPAVAQWVLYRLDGGIDHILVDEAQDTSPPQWRVIERLAQEFTAGHGAREAGERSLFVVGDQKQSIYSFQGADPAAFDRMRAHFARQLESQGGLRSTELQHSFRSSAAILRSVDAVFAGERAEGLGANAHHLAFHETMPGRVDVWPLVESEPASDPPAWYDPVDRVSPGSATVRLAEAVARQIRQTIDGGVAIPRAGGAAKAADEGDFLVLLQRRNTLFHEIIRACKAAGLEVAGADRLELANELAVKDLRALLSFLATPEDDLSLAALLRSPLCGWTEGALYDLAAGRGPKYLWQALREVGDDHPETWAMLKDLRSMADFLRPYDLLERVLVRHDGRRRILARLGEEAEDGIDELLTQALAYERTDIPSLTGFLGWLDADDVQVKRSADSAGGKVRVMTVHGAKGLEAPVVILPDTTRDPPQLRAELLVPEPGTVLWRIAKDRAPAPLADAADAVVAADERERLRLLYVAMTRAESWLIVAGVAPAKTGKLTQMWYGAITEGMTDLPLEPVETPIGPGERMQHGDWPGAAAESTPAAGADTPALPAWLNTHAHVPPEPEGPVSPSDLGGPKALPGEGLDEESAKLRGHRLHLLMEHLPQHDRADWSALAAQIAGLADDETGPLLAEAQRCLDAPDLAHVFAPGTLAEVPLHADLSELGGRAVSGIIDRLLVGDNEILAVDFKSNATIPAIPEHTPEGLLRQMGAYAAALKAIYPGHRVRTALLWTAEARLMELPDCLVMAALQRAQPS
ncbi:DNA helicase/exodeoxyribonuclease V, subunit A [Tranquillimonas rosea]|uniref:DNA 3'-5' helicase n=1 Tax=Tranquillimonas rosea TaxID=641238 RepID=A0A1H9UF13_9RHOB|nr:double-strand break repair helicase AddA [Tranquillimonas rosea]SES07747.1 DNA helicase/exodeoxyribonuclease V, subunit A [Tranquillimonas rosea]